MKYKTLVTISASLAFFTACSNQNSSLLGDLVRKNSIIGNWYTTGIKSHKGKLLVEQTRKEQFFKNGLLLSSKWFNFKDANGRDLGEYYITKSFKWHKQGNKIVVKFNRCSAGVTKELKVTNSNFNKLKNECQNSIGKKGKISTKSFKLVNSKTLLLGGMIYHKE